MKKRVLVAIVRPLDIKKHVLPAIVRSRDIKKCILIASACSQGSTKAEILTAQQRTKSISVRRNRSRLMHCS